METVNQGQDSRAATRPYNEGMKLLALLLAVLIGGLALTPAEAKPRYAHPYKARKFKAKKYRKAHRQRTTVRHTTAR